jgi:hypothetical protein
VCERDVAPRTIDEMPSNAASNFANSSSSSL